jgi:hypothetical protein
MLRATATSQIMETIESARSRLMDPSAGTSAGTYSVVLTAKSGSISHNTTLTLTVK